MRFRAFHSFLLVPFLVFRLLGQEGSLRVNVIAGEGQFVDIKRRVNPEPVVEVRDAKGNPVQDATVTFFLPAQGPGGTFSNGTTTESVLTTRDGLATATGIHPNNQTGPYVIRVAASYHGQTGSAQITQTNIVASSSSSGNGHGLGFGTRAWVILGICVGVAAAGAALALRNSGGKSTTPAIVITPGSPTVGAPQ